MANKKQNIMVEPSDSELAMYRQLISELSEEQMDEFTNEYFDLVQKEEISVSFPRFLMDKLIRPVKPGDTITYMDENSQVNYLFCLIRKDIEEKTYLLFAMVDNETEALLPDQVYLFYIDGYDENGIEILDIMPASEEAERILTIIEGDGDVKLVETNIQKEE